RVAEGEEEDEKGGSNAEIDEIRQGIEFGAEGARDLQLAGEKPVEPVDHRGEDDEERGELEILLEGEADGAEPGREAEDGDEIGQEMEERQAAGARVGALVAELRHGIDLVPGRCGTAVGMFGAGHQRISPWRGGSLESRSAITVSPAVMYWPVTARGETPSGR